MSPSSLLRVLVLAGGAWSCCGVGAQAQTVAPTAPLNVLQLQSSGSVEVVQDWLSLTLAVVKEGVDAAQVQTQLRNVLEPAMTEARKQVKPGQVEVRSGGFSVFPRYGREGKINGWQGSAELILEGRDIPALTAAASRLAGLNVTQLNFSLSREQRQQLESEAQSRAIQSFKARAADLSRQFGFSGYSLREVSVSSSDGGYSPRPRLMAAEAKMAAPMAAMADLPVEAGRSTVTVTVSGSIQMN